MKPWKFILICLLSISSFLSLCCIGYVIYNIDLYSKNIASLIYLTSPIVNGVPLIAYFVWVIYIFQFVSQIFANTYITITLVRKNAIADFKEWRKRKKEEKLINRAKEQKKAEEIAALEAQIQEIKNRKDG